MVDKTKEKAIYVSIRTWRLLNAIAFEQGITLKDALENLISTHPNTKNQLENIVKWAQDQVSKRP